MSLFVKKKNPSISAGLDIGTSYIKVIVLRKVSGRIVLDNSICRYAPGDALPVIKEISAKCRFYQKKVNVSLSGRGVIVRDLWLPIMEADELRRSLSYELDQYIPFSAADVYYDIYILEEGPLTRRGSQMRVVLAVAKKEHVNRYISMLEEAGLAAETVNVDAVSLFNIFSLFAKDEKTYALVDIGSAKTIIDILSGSVLAFSREVECGTLELRESAMRLLSLNRDDAEKMICSGDTKIQPWVQDTADKLVKEFWGSFEYYEGQEGVPVERMYITGGGAVVPGFADYLKKVMGMPVEIWHPFSGIESGIGGEEIERIKNTAPQFSNAAGLAVRCL